MDRTDDIRAGERTIDLPQAADAQLIFIGRIHTPWTSRTECPRQGRQDGPLCRIEVFAPWSDALQGLEAYPQIEVLYWLHQARRDLVLQSPRDDGQVRGTFSLRSPVRPNPIGLSLVKLEKQAGSELWVRGLDCLDGTPLIDLKPDRCAFTPIAPSTSADAQASET